MIQTKRHSLVSLSPLLMWEYFTALRFCDAIVVKEEEEERVCCVVVVVVVIGRPKHI